jgi:hypothetical protein
MASSFMQEVFGTTPYPWWPNMRLFLTSVACRYLTVGIEIIELGKAIVFANVSIEMELSEMDEMTGHKTITACGDCRWDKRSSGWRYDSISGCSIMIGRHSQMVLDIAPMSNTCAKCSRNLPHPPELCPKNVECSSKGMEAIGSAKIEQDIFVTYNTYIHEYVGDDDFSTKKVLWHSWKEEMERGLIDELPKYDIGRFKPDNGLLPIDHPSIICLANKGHRVRQFASKLFALCRQKNTNCEGNSMDAKHLKHNLSYAIRINCHSTLAVLRGAVESVLEHHFNNHSLCGLWCKVKNLVGREREEVELKYRSKQLKGFFYLQVKTLFDEFYPLLAEMLHDWDTNIVEGMNKFVTKFLPKDRTYAMSIENQVRLYLAISIDSVGYTEIYCFRLGLPL